MTAKAVIALVAAAGTFLSIGVSACGRAERLPVIGEVPAFVLEDQTQQPVDAIGCGRGRKIAQLSDHHEIIQATQMTIQMRLFGHVPHPLFIRSQVGFDGFTVE